MCPRWAWGRQRLAPCPEETPLAPTKRRAHRPEQDWIIAVEFQEHAGACPLSWDAVEGAVNRGHPYLLSKVSDVPAT